MAYRDDEPALDDALAEVAVELGVAREQSARLAAELGLRRKALRTRRLGRAATAAVLLAAAALSYVVRVRREADARDAALQALLDADNRSLEHDIERERVDARAIAAVSRLRGALMPEGTDAADRLLFDAVRARDPRVVDEAQLVVAAAACRLGDQELMDRSARKLGPDAARQLLSFCARMPSKEAP